MARATATIALIAVMEMTIVGAAAVPGVLLLSWLARLPATAWGAAVLVGAGSAPAYVLFALCLMTLSAASTRLTAARTPVNAQMRIADMEWPVLNWARHMASTHVVRVLAGVMFRGTPLWTMYLRMAGARIGRRVYVNSLFLSDYNLLTLGNDVVIGAGVHLSGHTVERGVVKTGAVTLGDGVTIGLSSIIDIDVEIGARAQVGVLSFVPKHARLAPDRVYVGVPVAVREPPAIFGTR